MLSRRVKRWLHAPTSRVVAVAGRKVGRRMRRWLQAPGAAPLAWEQVQRELVPLSRNGRGAATRLAPLPMPELRPRILADLLGQPHQAEGFRRVAERLLRHEFHLFGEWVPMACRQRGRDGDGLIDWHCDWVSGHRFPRHGSVSMAGAGRPGVDIRRPWELSRFLHLPALGIAFWLAESREGEGGEEGRRLAAAFQSQVRDWLSQNPPGHGVNWACPMEVAIRASNWTMGYEFFRHSPLLSHDFHDLLRWGLWRHGKYLWENLENDHLYTNNHYISDLIGLLYVAVALPEAREAASWRSWAMRELASEIVRQGSREGVHGEGSLNYHRYVTELGCWAVALGRAGLVPISREFEDHVARMVEFVSNYTKPNGLVPLMGDSDDSRLHMFMDYAGWDPRDHRYVLSLGAALFGRSEFARAAAGNAEGAWIPPAAGCGTTTRSAGPAAQGSAAFPDAGIFLFRHQEDYLLVRCASLPYGGISCHAHNDCLSLELHVGGRDFFVDPGTYLYTSAPEERNAFRSTAAHNAMWLVGQEQNEFGPSVFDYADDRGSGRLLEWTATGKLQRFRGEHRGYRGPDGVLCQRRAIEYDPARSRWEIMDELAWPDAAGKESPDVVLPVRWTFCLHPAVQVTPVRNGQQQWLLRSGDVTVLFEFEFEGSAEVAPGWYSPRYGHRQRTASLRIDARVHPGTLARFRMERTQ